MDQSKPHKGEIHWWSKMTHSAKSLSMNGISGSLGYSITGFPKGHPDFKNWIRTSPVIAHEGNEVETLNSRYTLVGEEGQPIEGL